jgi:hypothetical protein
MASLCADLDTALIQSQGVLDAMANLSSWLDLAENQLNAIQKPASLVPDRLDEQIRQLKLLEAGNNFDYIFSLNYIHSQLNFNLSGSCFKCSRLMLPAAYCFHFSDVPLLNISEQFYAKINH